MKIKDAVYDKGCPSCGCGKKIITDTVYGCDFCKKQISSPYDKERTYLEITVFYNSDKETDRLQFCSWECVFKFMSKIQKTKYKSDYFVNLPYIHFDGSKPGYKDFLKALRGARRTLRKFAIQHLTAQAQKLRRSLWSWDYRRSLRALRKRWDAIRIFF